MTDADKPTRGHVAETVQGNSVMRVARPQFPKNVFGMEYESDIAYDMTVVGAAG